MGIFDKVKNLFTEEVEEEPVIKKEVRHIEVEAPKRVEKPKFEEEVKEEIKEEKKDDKFVFFSDDDFKDLERTSYNKDEDFEKPSYYRKKEEKIEKPSYSRREESISYSRKKEEPISRVTEIEERKTFKPSLIISPVYGVLDKNYSKDEIVHKKTTVYKNPETLSVDDIRNKAYGTLEDELKDALLGKREETIVDDVNDIDIFEELDKYDDTDEFEKEKDIIDVDDLFDSLDNKKEEILDELDNKKEEILDELDSKKDGIIINDEEVNKDQQEELKKEIENQKKKLDEINDILSESEDTISENDDDLNESELFDLIDSIYEKKGDE